MAIPDKSLTRTEQYLNRIATGGGTIPEEAYTRIEMYLNKIATGSGEVPEKALSRLEQYLAAIAENGGGSSITVEPLTVTSNGTQTAPSGKAYSPVTVNVPQPSGTKNITISQNGTTTENVKNYASASITVNVPNVNPNSYEEISGTLSNPWGDINPSELMAEMTAESGYFSTSITNAIFALTIPNMGSFNLPVALDNWNNPTAFVASALNYAPALGASTPQGGCLIYGANGALISAYMYVNGTLTDVASQMAQAPTSLCVYRHPLGDD